MAKVAVIIVAAGKSSRFGGQEKKVFTKLDGRPIFLRTLEQFMNRDDVCKTTLVISPDDEEEVKRKYGANLGFLGVTLVVGGAERHDSVANGLAVTPDDADLIAIHDAARPCVTADMIDRVFAEAEKSGAAILAAPLQGTIKRAGESMVIDETVSREGLWEAQTPQVFRKDLILDASKRRDEVKTAITDDAQLAEALGHPVAVVPSDMTNLKITTKSDLALANAIVKSRPAPKPKARFGAFDEAQW